MSSRSSIGGARLPNGPVIESEPLMTLAQRRHYA